MPPPIAWVSLKTPLRRLPLQPAKPLGEERPHPLRDVILGEERGRIDSIRDEVRQVKNSVAAGGVEGRCSRDAGLPNGSHRFVIRFRTGQQPWGCSRRLVDSVRPFVATRIIPARRGPTRGKPTTCWPLLDPPADWTIWRERPGRIRRQPLPCGDSTKRNSARLLTAPRSDVEPPTPRRRYHRTTTPVATCGCVTPGKSGLGVEQSCHGSGWRLPRGAAVGAGWPIRAFLAAGHSRSTGGATHRAARSTAAADRSLRASFARHGNP